MLTLNCASRRAGNSLAKHCYLFSPLVFPLSNGKSLFISFSSNKNVSKKQLTLALNSAGNFGIAKYQSGVAVIRFNDGRIKYDLNMSDVKKI